MLLVQITRIFNFMKNSCKVRNSKRVVDINSNTKDGGDKYSSLCLACPSSWFHGNSVCCILHSFLSEQQQRPWCLAGDGREGSPSIILVESVVPACVHMQWSRRNRVVWQGVLRELRSHAVDTTPKQSWSFSSCGPRCIQGDWGIRKLELHNN